MTQGTYIPPEVQEDRFTCPLCHTLAPQDWCSFYHQHNQVYVNRREVWRSTCDSCKKACLWFGDEMIYPDTGNAPLPNGDLSDEVRGIYEEAASIAQKSPRAAAGLLRLAIEALCFDLKCEGENLQDKINSLADKDINLQEVVESMNAVRLVGNASVHVGIIEINENPDIVADMFELINFAAEQLITAPKKRAAIIDRANKLREESKNKESELGRE